jgi:hypothetical protein
MGNIHVLPTDKPSGLFKDENQHIYITSDEEIKEGDWYISFLENEVYKATKETQNIMSVANLVGSTSYKKTHFKIILTTDQDLIKDGVQAIDDDFLEWFVKNPSCEEVEVEKLEGRYVDYSGNVHSPINYKIIIPKEEAKQDEIDFIANELAIEKEMEKQQQGYSEEDMTEAFRVGFNIGCNDVESPHYLIFEEWFKNGLKKIKNK